MRYWAKVDEGENEEDTQMGRVLYECSMQKKKKKNPQIVEGAKKIANSKNGFLKCNLRGLMVLRGILCPELKRVSPALLFKSGFTWNIGDKSGLLPLTETLTNQKKRRQQLRWVRT